MKKIILTLGLFTIFVIGSNQVFASGYGYISAPTEVNRNFSGLMQHRFEKEESLDFINNPEAYKKKRENKEKFLDYQEGKVKVPQRQTEFNLSGSRQQIPQQNMEFTNDGGQIRIREIR